jgi:hypothetical protein
MKKLGVSLFISALLLIPQIASAADVDTYVNGQKVDFEHKSKSYASDGYIAFADYYKYLGYDINYTEKGNLITAQKPGSGWAIIQFRISEPNFVYIDGHKSKIPEPTSTSNRVLYVPLKSMQAITGRDIYWDNTKVSIANPPKYIWLLDDQWKNKSTGEFEDLPHLAKAELISVDKDPNLDDWYNINIQYNNVDYVSTIGVPNYRIDTEYLTTNPYVTYDFSDEVWNLIKQHKIWRGMTKDMFWLVYPFSPDHINTYDSGHEEQWVYESSTFHTTDYYYFEDGILTSWQKMD